MGTHLRVLCESYPMNIATSQDLDGFQKSFHPCDLDLSIRMVNLRLTWRPTFKYIEAYLVDQTFMNANCHGQVGKHSSWSGHLHM